MRRFSTLAIGLIVLIPLLYTAAPIQPITVVATKQQASVAAEATSSAPCPLYPIAVWEHAFTEPPFGTLASDGLTPALEPGDRDYSVGAIENKPLRRLFLRDLPDATEG